ncbi:MAG: hypothetical protein RLZ98_294 [Pseudomonadota bacterium]|jgi:membrane-bound metal-dependent hydrolase YbcI (DUF457 family)
MANFATHIGAGTVVSGTLATLTVAANVIGPQSVVAVTLAGVLGSVLPDIDLKDSRPSRVFFSALAVFLSFCALFAAAHKYSIAEIWLAWIGSFVIVRYGISGAFHRFSYHRGIWHSILAGLFFWFLTAIVFKYLLGFHEGVAWLAGGFLFIGYLTHLLLDEFYSVDLMGNRLKRSFGSAFKLVDAKNPGDTTFVAILTAAAFMIAPPSAAFVDGITSKQLWAGLHQRLLPEEKWFGFIGKLDDFNIVQPKQGVQGADITTGSIPPAPRNPPAFGK